MTASPRLGWVLLVDQEHGTVFGCLGLERPCVRETQVLAVLPGGHHHAAGVVQDDEVAGGGLVSHLCRQRRGCGDA